MGNMEEQELLPCPFCGESEELQILDACGDHHWVRCACGAEPGDSEEAQSIDQAIKAWNRRENGKR